MSVVVVVSILLLKSYCQNSWLDVIISFLCVTLGKNGESLRKFVCFHSSHWSVPLQVI